MALPALPLSLQMEEQLLAAEARMEELSHECGRSLAAERRADQAEVRALSPPIVRVGFPTISLAPRLPSILATEGESPSA
jgi:hypothetical protein